MRQIFALCLVAACSTLWSACSNGDATTLPAATPVVKNKPLVRVALATNKEVKRHIEVSGNILQNRKATVTTSVPGTIRRIYKQEGDPIRKGEKLVELDPRDFKLVVQQAAAGLQAARAGAAAAATGLANLEVQYRRFLGLHKKGAVAQAEFEKVETGYKATRSKVEAVRAQVRLAEVGLKTARKKLSDTVARAPFDGVVTQRMMDPGEKITVMPPAMVMVVMDIDPVKAEGQVAERDVSAISKGAAVEVAVDALPDRRISGQVETVVPFVNPATRTTKIRVRIPNPKHTLKPGMSATLRIVLAHQQVLVVPREAITARTGDRASVFVVDGQNRARRRKVTLDGSVQGPEAVVLSGLRTGERVVVAGLSELSDGKQVRLREGRSGPAGKKQKATARRATGLAPKATETSK